MQQFIFDVLSVVIPILVTFILTQLTRYLNVKIGEENFNKALIVISAVVDAVEQQFTGAIDKKAIAMDYARKLGLNLTEEQLDMLIEAAVKGMKDAGLEIKKDAVV